MVMHVADLRRDSLLSDVFPAHVGIDDDHVLQGRIRQFRPLELGYLGGQQPLHLCWRLGHARVLRTARHLNHLTRRLVDLRGQWGDCSAALPRRLHTVLL